jgi:hypothetical protein
MRRMLFTTLLAQNNDAENVSAGFALLSLKAKAD